MALVGKSQYEDISSKDSVLNSKTAVQKAFVLINCYNGLEKAVKADLKLVGEVLDTVETQGFYELIIRIESNSISQLKEIIVNKIRKIQGVKETVTLMT